ncbi:MAG: GNAT family N-acetyltransferase [Ruminococcus sp.]|nr:GNAT family N-acetyltransferase [Ruminococcus sp.]
MDYIIREIKNSDFQQLMELYTHLHEKDIPEKDARVSAVWESILSDKNHHIIVAEYEGKIISSCVCVIIPNLTRNQRPYAFVENVVTHADYRGNGIATACLDYARDIAKKENCYKLMLLTGSKNEKTLNFYRRAGYNSEDKTAFIQWLG